MSNTGDQIIRIRSHPGAGSLFLFNALSHTSEYKESSSSNLLPRPSSSTSSKIITKNDYENRSRLYDGFKSQVFNKTLAVHSCQSELLSYHLFQDDPAVYLYGSNSGKGNIHFNNPRRIY
jgi:hypothetical protein